MLDTGDTEEEECGTICRSENKSVLATKFLNQGGKYETFPTGLVKTKQPVSNLILLIFDFDKFTRCK